MMSVENIIELKGIKKRFEDNFEAVPAGDPGGKPGV